MTPRTLSILAASILVSIKQDTNTPSMHAVPGELPPGKSLDQVKIARTNPMVFWVNFNDQTEKWWSIPNAKPS